MIKSQKMKVWLSLSSFLFLMTAFWASECSFAQSSVFSSFASKTAPLATSVLAEKQKTAGYSFSNDDAFFLWRSAKRG